MMDRARDSLGDEPEVTREDDEVVVRTARSEFRAPSLGDLEEALVNRQQEGGGDDLDEVEAALLAVRNERAREAGLPGSAWSEES
jgi:hypothetical protein